MGDLGMGTTHAWESFGDNEPPDIQAVAKGLGGGCVAFDRTLQWRSSDFSIDTPPSVPSLCRNGLLTESGTRMVSGSMGIRTWFILITFFSSFG